MPSTNKWNIDIEIHALEPNKIRQAVGSFHLFAYTKTALYWEIANEQTSNRANEQTAKRMRKLTILSEFNKFISLRVLWVLRVYVMHRMQFTIFVKDCIYAIVRRKPIQLTFELSRASIATLKIGFA